MTKIILSTGNIVASGPSIIRKPGTSRSNLELTNSLRSNFLAAQQDYAAALENGNGNGNHTRPNGNHQPNGRPAADVWTAREGAALYIPRIDWSSAGLLEERPQYEVTVKLFYLPTAPAGARPKHTREALELVGRELRADTVDLLIVSFPGVSFEGDCEWEADRLNAAMGDDEQELATWAALEALHREGRVGRLGIAEFGSEKLRRFLGRVKVRPAVDQINVRNCCSVPPPLTELARKENIELFTHNDCTDILPSGTLRELLGQSAQGAGVLADDGVGGGSGLRGNLIPQWVVKYTAVVKDRGVIENKGYFAGAELVEA